MKVGYRTREASFTGKAAVDEVELGAEIVLCGMKLLQAWIELHKDELVADWELALSGQQPYKIEPLR